ncbi:TPA: polymer-forming cytoskeletal protein [Streptococcus suis]|nr:polymer-forming cytoskeletal protein [Streptococcus suis]
MTKKYELVLDDTISFWGWKLFRIRALISFGSVEVGDLGGYIEKEENLSHDGNAWVYGNAKVSGNAKVWGNAEVLGNAKVWGNAEVWGNAKVWGNAEVYGNAKVSGNAKVWGNAKVSGNAKVWGNAEVLGNAKVWGNAEVLGNAEVSELGDIIVFKNHWSSGRHFTYTKSNKMWKVGCFYGTGQELIEKAYRDSEKSGNYYKAYVDFVATLERLSEE